MVFLCGHFWGQRCFFTKIVERASFVEVFLDRFFWENKIDSLFTVLFGYKFTLLDGGSSFEVLLEKGGILQFLKNVFMEIENVK